MSKERYEIPDEVATLMRKAEALIELRDIYTKLPFGFKKARKCAIDQQEYRSKFWKKVNELYPELKNKRLSFNITGTFVWIIND